MSAELPRQVLAQDVDCGDVFRLPGWDDRNRSLVCFTCVTDVRYTMTVITAVEHHGTSSPVLTVEKVYALRIFRTFPVIVTGKVKLDLVVEMIDPDRITPEMEEHCGRLIREWDQTHPEEG